jgi:hypothetical protein
LQHDGEELESLEIRRDAKTMLATKEPTGQRDAGP